MNKDSPHFPALCGVVVIFHPEEPVVQNVLAMIKECGELIVVDNGSSPEIRARLNGLSGSTVIELRENIGVAAALNIGAARAMNKGFLWIVTFDQDSCPEPGMVATLWAAHLRRPQAALVVPCIAEGAESLGRYRWVRPHPRFPGLFQRIPCLDNDVSGIIMAVTSGSLTELSVWADLGGFDEGLFIDYVDTDFCLKVIDSGREILVAAGAILKHKLGNRRDIELFGYSFHPTFHPPFRHYYMTRNRIQIWRRYACRMPHWALFDLMFFGFNLFRVIAFEDQKGLKIQAVLRGTWDGLLGKSGKTRLFD